MNQDEELAAAEALNQLRARRKVEGRAAAAKGTAPQAVAAPQNSAQPTGRATNPEVKRTEHTHNRDPPIRAEGAIPVVPESPGSEAASTTAATTETKANADSGIRKRATRDAPARYDSSVGSDGPGSTEPPRRPWRNVLLTATGMMLTRDARKKLRQLLAVLRLASEHLNSRVSALKVAMDADASNDGVKPKYSKQALRRDIITTIKKCLAMISALATNSLPAVARDSVRSTILKLPSRWASQMEAGSGSIDSDTSETGETESAILALATETLVSIGNITLIISETLDRADNWVERLPKFRGKRQREADPPSEPYTKVIEDPTRSPSPSSLHSSLQSLPVTRPSSPEIEEKAPTPKAIKVTDTDENTDASANGKVASSPAVTTH